MKLKDPKQWKELVRLQRELHRFPPTPYIKRWANLMEKAMAAGSKLEDIAEVMFFKADPGRETHIKYDHWRVISHFVEILSQVWEHGERLRRWHGLTTQQRVFSSVSPK